MQYVDRNKRRIDVYKRQDQRTQRAYIPNEEIRQEFRAATKRNKWNELIEFQQESEKLLEATWEMDAETVAEQIEKIHAEYTSVIQYNNENSLSSVLSIACLSAIKSVSYTHLDVYKRQILSFL